MRNQVPGHVTDIHFKNVEVVGAPGPYRIQINGADNAHGVSNVSFENVRITDEKLTGASKRLEVGQHVTGVRVGN
jgi:hypothetical protein